METQLKNSKFEKKILIYSTSNTVLLELLLQDTSFNKLEIEETFKTEKFRKKIKNLLKYYEPRKEEANQSFFSTKKFFNDTSVNDILKEIILKASDSLNLTLDQSFDEVNMYFYTEEMLFKTVKDNNEIFTAFQQNPSSSPEEKLKLDHFLKAINEKIIHYYFQERLNLLKIFYKISMANLQSQQSNPLHKLALKLFNDLGVDTIKTVWNQYKVYNKQYKIVHKHNEELILKENETLNIMKEQGILLDNLLMLINRKNYNEKTFFFDLLKTFNEQKFSGYVPVDLYSDHTKEFIDAQNTDYSIIKDLCMFILIQSFGVFKKNLDLNEQKMPFAIYNNEESIKTLTSILSGSTNSALSPLALQFYLTMKQILQIKPVPPIPSEAMRELNILENDESTRRILSIPSITNIFSYVSSVYERDIFNIVTEREIYFPTYCSTILQWLSIFYTEKEPEILSHILTLLKKSCMIRSTVMEIIQDLEIKISPISEFFQNMLNSFPKSMDYLIEFCNILVTNLYKSKNHFTKRIFESLKRINNVNFETDFDSVIPKNDQADIKVGDTVILNTNKQITELIIIPAHTEANVIAKVSGKLTLVSNLNIDLTSFLMRIWEETNNELMETGINKDIINSYEYVQLFLNLFYQNPENFETYLNDGRGNESYYIQNFLKLSFDSLLRILDFNIKYGENYLSEFVKAQLRFLNVLVDDDRYFEIIRNYVFEFKDIYLNILKFDGENGNFTNSVYVLKLIKKLLKIPRVIQYIKTNIDLPIDFIRSILSESYRWVSNIDPFKSLNQIKFAKELVKVIKALVKLIVFNPNKAEILTRNKEILFFEFVIRILNYISIIPLIIRLLKITIRENVKENTDIRVKILCEMTVNYKSPTIFLLREFEKLTTLILKTFSCFSYILDILISYTLTTDVFIKNYYEQLTTLQVFLRDLNLKNWPSYDVKTTTGTYKINFFLALFGYINYEEENNSDFIYKNYRVLDIFSKNKSASDRNVSSTSLKCISKIIYLINLNKVNDKTQSITDYFFIKKDNYSPNSINYLGKVREVLNRIIFSDNPCLRNEALQFLIICVENQMPFFSNFLIDKNKKTLGDFFNILDKLNCEISNYRIPEIKKEYHHLYNSVGYMTILISNIFINEGFYLGLILSIINNHSQKFLSFLDNAIKFFPDSFNINQVFSQNSKQADFDILLKAELLIKEKCFSYIILKSLFIIFSKLISINNKFSDKFQFKKQLCQLLNDNTPVLLEEFPYFVDLQNLEKFNSELQDENNFKSEEMMNIIPSIFILKNTEKILYPDTKSYYLYALDSMELISYNRNFHIDLKELFIYELSNNYNTAYLTKSNYNVIVYNHQVSLLDAQLKCFESFTHLLCLCFALGKDGVLFSNCLFIDEKYVKYTASNKSKDFENNYLKIAQNKNPNFNFFFLDCWENFNNFKEFSNKILDSFLKFRMDIKNFNYYSKYNFNKYNILNACLHFYFYSLTLKSEELKESSNTLLLEKCIKILSTLDVDVEILLTSVSSNELEIFINIVISNVFLIINHFVNSENKPQHGHFFDILDNIVKKLVTQFEYQNNFHTLIIYVLHSYLRLTKIYNFKNSIICDEKHRIISLIIRKITTLTQEHEFMAILNFCIRLVDFYPDICEYLFEEKIVSKFLAQEAFSNIKEYEEGERSVNHVLWCWTLIFIRQLAGQFALKVNNRNFFVYLIDCLKSFSDRIVFVFSNSEYIDKSGFNIEKSLALLEELEYFSSLICILFQNSHNWKSDHPEFYNKFVLLTLTSTLKLYQTNLKITAHYIPFSNTEKLMNQITNEAFTSEPKDYFTSISSPVKSFKNAAPLLDSDTLNEQKLLSKTNTPSLFIFKVETTLAKILYWVSYIIKFVIHSDYNFQKYLIEIWKKGNYRDIDEQSMNLVFSISFCCHFMEKLVKNNEGLKKLLEKYSLFVSNVNANISFGMLNLIYETDFEEIFNLNEDSIDNLLLIIMNFHKILNYLKTTTRCNFNDNSIREISLKKIDNLHNLYREYYSRINIEEKAENLSSMEEVLNFYKNQIK